MLANVRKKFRYFILTILLTSAANVSAEVSIPPLSSSVTDLTKTLSKKQIELLEIKLKDLETRKGSQLAIFILPTTDGETIEQFSLRVVEKWKLGRKKTDDGVLILVAKDDRKMRIEVGYGLEGVLPDVICKRIITEQMRPNFKAQRFYEGIDSAVESILKSIDGEALPPASSNSSPENTYSPSFVPAILGAGIISFFVIIFGAAITSGFASTTMGHLIGSGIFGLVGSFFNMGFLGSEHLPETYINLLCILSFFIIFCIIYFMSKSSGNGYSDGGSWSSSSSDSWSSSSSSDSYSGGGGNFGGGGASGDW